MALLPDKYSPLTREGTGNQGYLFRLPDRAAQFLFEVLERERPSPTDPVAAGVERLSLDVTTRKALVESRLGQGWFRQSLLKQWGSRCARDRTRRGRTTPASHIKPWRSSNNEERLDPANGLLLAPHYDAAFDRGFISFEVDGRLTLSPGLSSANVAALGLQPDARLCRVDQAHLPYLAYHAADVFWRSN